MKIPTSPILVILEGLDTVGQALPLPTACSWADATRSNVFRVHVILHDAGIYCCIVTSLLQCNQNESNMYLAPQLRWSTWLKPTGPLVPVTHSDDVKPNNGCIYRQLSLPYLVIDSHHALSLNLHETVPTTCYFLGGKSPRPLWSQHQQQPVQWSRDGRWWWCWEPRPPPHAATMSSLVSSSATGSSASAVRQHRAQTHWK